MASGILVIAELKQGKATPLCYELLGLASRLATATGAKAGIALLGKSEDGVAQALVQHGADEVFVCEDSSLDEYRSDAWMPWVLNIVAETQPSAIFLPHTTMGADLAPRLAFRLKTGVAMGCVAVAAEDEKLKLTRPCYGNLAREVVSFTTSPVIGTIKSKTQDPAVADAQRVGDVRTIDASAAPATRTRIVDRRREAEGGIRLENAKIVVAGGRGLGGPEGFDVLGKLAQTLGGAVGASRVACDLGWCPPSWQIGLTGKTVTPDLYVAVGISGASHHLAGIGGAKHILAINSDPDAAMFKEASFGVVGDYKQIVPALVAALNRPPA